MPGLDSRWHALWAILAVAGCGDKDEDVDADNDGFTASADCNDDYASVNPDATELPYNGRDDDCEEATPDDDLDGDGASLDADCDDGDASRYPAAPETCDDIDQDCDGEVDEGALSTWHLDVDGDGYGDPDATVQACEQPAGALTDDTDCDDTDPAIHPGAAETCETSWDDDCDGDREDPDALAQQTWYLDTDGDGEGDPEQILLACSTPDGAVASAEDCDDADPGVNPSAEERCDTIDNDCDGRSDDEDNDTTDLNTWHYDADSDGFGDPELSTEGCLAPSGTVEDSADCDDGEAEINPEATEQAGDEVDQDCDGLEICFVDADGDGYRPDGGASVDSPDLSCADAGEADGSTPTGDCDDDDANTSPDTPEIWYDGTDADCSGGSDYDQDGDGQDAESAAGEDCDDTRDDVYSGATEEGCDLLDQDCDGGDVDYRSAVAPAGSVWLASFESVQDAIIAADEGDTICVAPGEYKERIDLEGKGLSLIGAGGPEVTILDGEDEGIVVWMDALTSAATLRGFTVMRGFNDATYDEDETNGAGIYVRDAEVSLRELILEDNNGWSCVGLYLEGTTATLEDIVIQDNFATYLGGGGCLIADTVATATGLLVQNNTAGYRGGGLEISYGAELNLNASSILDNTAGSTYAHGGGLFVRIATLTLDGVRVWGNAGSDAIYVDSSTLRADHLDVRDNATDGVRVVDDDRASELTATNAIFACNLGSAIVNQGTLTLTNATMVGNASDEDGGALRLDSIETSTLTNTTMAQNTATAGGAVAVAAGSLEPTITYSHVYANDPDDYDGMDDPTGVSGNITGNPRFSDSSSADCTLWDLTLTSTSLLKGAGSDDTDIGAYGGPAGDAWPVSWPE